MRDAIVAVAPAVELTQDRNLGWARRLGWSMKLGNATLAFSDCTARDATWGGWEAPAFAVDAWGGIGLRFPQTYHGYEGRAHSLWFGDIQEEGHSAWYETSFMLAGFSGRASTVDPFDLEPGERSAKAVWNGIAEYQVAWPFTRLLPENLDEFIERWASWFAQAAQGQLRHPSHMPERPPQDHLATEVNARFLPHVDGFVLDASAPLHGKDFGVHGHGAPRVCESEPENAVAGSPNWCMG